MKNHHTKEKGDLGLYFVILDLVKKGYKIFTSNSEHLPFDIVAYKENRFFRIQVKYRKAHNSRLTISFRTSWADKNGTHIKKYNKDEIDFFGIYCPDTEKCYYVNPSEFNEGATLRIKPTKNNQTANINFAENYLELDSVETKRETPEMVKV